MQQFMDVLHAFDAREGFIFYCEKQRAFSFVAMLC